MTQNQDPQKLLRQAARLQTLVAVGKAKLAIAQAQQVLSRAKRGADKPRVVANTLSADLMCRIALKADGTPFDDDPADVMASDLVEPEIVRLGTVKLRVIDANPVAFAAATGAMDEGSGCCCMLVEFEQAAGQPQPCMGQYVVLPTGVERVALTFLVWVTHADVKEAIASSAGPDAERNVSLASLGPNQALLVLELPDGEGAT